MCWIWNNIEKISNVLNVIISSLTLCLAYYVFVIQREKEKEDRKIQWMKELIIIPRYNFIGFFFTNLTRLKDEIKTESLTEDVQQKLINFIKEEASEFRKNFLIFIQETAPKLHEDISSKIDDLIDGLTEKIADDEFKLNNSKTYEKQINQKIQDCHSFVIKQIFNYQGNDRKT